MKYNKCLAIIAIAIIAFADLKLIPMEADAEAFNAQSENKDAKRAFTFSKSYEGQEHEFSTGEEAARAVFNDDENEDEVCDYSKAESFKRNTKMSFKDFVDGMPDAVLNAVNMLHNINDEIYKRDIKDNEMYGILLYGPPGTGKSSIAEAIAFESKRDFYHISASAIVTKFQGSGSDTIRTIIKQVKSRNRPSVIFIDEVDGISNNDAKAGTNLESGNAVFALHEEVDKHDVNIFYVFATNNVDKVTIGLESRCVRTNVPLADKHARKKLLQHYSCNRVLNVSANFFDELAAQMPGFSCREIKRLSRAAYNLAFTEYKNNNTKERLAVTEDHYKIAFMTAKEQPITDCFYIELLFKYYLSRVGAKYFDNINFQKISKESVGLSNKEIENAIKNSHGLANDRNSDKAISIWDFYAGIYYTQKVKFANRPMREILIRYFFKFSNPAFENDVYDEIAKHAKDDFTGEELEQIVTSAKHALEVRKSSMGLSSLLAEISEEDAYVGLYTELNKKAKRFEITKNKYTEIKSHASIGMSIGVSAKVLNASCNFNWSPPCFDSHDERKSEECKQLKQNEEFLQDTTIGDIIKKTKRLDFRTQLNPSLKIRLPLITYFLREYSHELSEEQIKEFAEKACLSWYSLKQCIEESLSIASEIEDVFCFSYKNLVYILGYQYDILLNAKLLDKSAPKAESRCALS